MYIKIMMTGKKYQEKITNKKNKGKKITRKK